jgi:uncharacterized protein (TIGR03066 family)
MQLLRWSLLGSLMVGLAGCGGANTTKPAPSGGGSSSPAPQTQASNKDKILGSWNMTKLNGKAPPGEMAVEFTKDGKMKQSAKIGGQTMTNEGTYQVEGTKLMTTEKGPDKKEKKDTATIEKLTDTELVVKDDKGEVTEFKKK